ncbi:hypothetical protein [Pseudomonas aeruginosa]|uniref:PHIKZ111 n=3 Tax=root TaxID=1 RepID=Q8SD51_BPDPK|nr:PHIKZ111 [Pseudomonas phage phiKZ]ANM44899.1 hypothetical protein KTN4_141 [Pseudomonas phage KTN4]MBG7006414.1 hypothetical protein [Pseudomonas aeruginosa]WPJ69261.1 hypothetical protein PAZH1_138 [Pseudomonas phage PA_ZH1]BDR26901.1 hypothetical protein RVBP20_1420 [Pseudomonas phage sp. NK1]AAL83012.1 PHIKZ111 [Pseudomonas phage phiKZ]
MNRMIPANERDSELSLYGYLTSVVTGGVAWDYNPIVLLEKMCNRDDEAICMGEPNYDQLRLIGARGMFEQISENILSRNEQIMDGVRDFFKDGLQLKTNVDDMLVRLNYQTVHNGTDMGEVIMVNLFKKIDGDYVVAHKCTYDPQDWKHALYYFTNASMISQKQK